MQCADADALFTIVHVGDFSKNRNGSLIKASTIEGALGETFFHYLATDEAFPLIKLMRLYLRRMLTNKRCILNCRLSSTKKKCGICIWRTKGKVQDI
jgi:hypothetical protein